MAQVKVGDKFSKIVPIYSDKVLFADYEYFDCEILSVQKFNDYMKVSISYQYERDYSEYFIDFNQKIPREVYSYIRDVIETTPEPDDNAIGMQSARVTKQVLDRIINKIKPYIEEHTREFGIGVGHEVEFRKKYGVTGGLILAEEYHFYE